MTQRNGPMASVGSALRLTQPTHSSPSHRTPRPERVYQQCAYPRPFARAYTAGVPPAEGSLHGGVHEVRAGRRPGRGFTRPSATGLRVTAVGEIPRCPESQTL